MDYFNSVTDANGYIHSVDNVTVMYYITGLGTKEVDRFLDKVHLVRDNHPGVNYWERLNCTPCTRFSWFCHQIHLDDGIFLSLGQYGDYWREEKRFLLFPVAKLEVNPNKHFGNPAFTELLDILKKDCYDSKLNKYDYAVDIPVVMDDVQVFGTRKEKGLYKGTRYYGQRNKNGYCKIYDKQKEQGLDTPLTRVEHTFSNVKTTKGLSFEDVYIRTETVSGEVKKLNSTYTAVVELCVRCRDNGLDYEDIIARIDKRCKQSIMQAINSCNYCKLDFDREIHDRLLDKVRDYFGIFDYGKTDDFYEDEKGFLHVTDDVELPFD